MSHSCPAALVSSRWCTPRSIHEKEPLPPRTLPIRFPRHSPHWFADLANSASSAATRTHAHMLTVQEPVGPSRRGSLLIVSSRPPGFVSAASESERARLSWLPSGLVLQTRGGRGRPDHDGGGNVRHESGPVLGSGSHRGTACGCGSRVTFPQPLAGRLRLLHESGCFGQE